MISGRKITKYLKIYKDSIPIWIYGDLKNLPILFVHGYPFAFSDYKGNLPIKYLKKEFCIIAFDLPGFGKSRNLTLDNLSFIKLVADKIIPKRKFVLFGTSSGGLIVLQYSFLYKEKVLGVIVSGLPYPTRILKYLLRGGVIMKFFKRNLYELAKNLLFLNSDNLKKIKARVLLLYSKKDRIATPKMGKRLGRELPNAKLVVVDNRIHGWLLHRIDENEFLPAINKFLKNFS